MPADLTPADLAELRRDAESGLPDRTMIISCRGMVSLLDHIKDLRTLLAAPLINTRARRKALEEAARWHDERARDTPDAFEMELHQASASAIRALATPAEPAGDDLAEAVRLLAESEEVVIAALGPVDHGSGMPNWDWLRQYVKHVRAFLAEQRRQG